MANEANRKENQDKKPKLFTSKDEGTLKQQFQNQGYQGVKNFMIQKNDQEKKFINLNDGCEKKQNNWFNDNMFKKFYQTVHKKNEKVSRQY